jgi:uncharacterized protein (TIGR02246 family)
MIQHARSHLGHREGLVCADAAWQGRPGIVHRPLQATEADLPMPDVPANAAGPPLPRTAEGGPRRAGVSRTPGTTALPGADTTAPGSDDHPRAARSGHTGGMNEDVAGLYRALLDGWNRGDAAAFADCFADHGSMVGFDGSTVDGRPSIERHLAAVFADHRTAAYVARVDETRPLGPDTALLRAVAGMVPPGTSDLNPALNAVQSLVARRSARGGWRIEHFQTTPAAFHGRPEESAQLTRELREVLRGRG